jgi:Sigma-70 region 2
MSTCCAPWLPDGGLARNDSFVRIGRAARYRYGRQSPLEAPVTGIEVAGFERATAEGRKDAPIDPLEWRDPHDLERVYLEHHLAVYRYLRARTRSDDEATELTAVVFERALAALHRYKPSRSGPLA